ncbi:MAG: hypothetical protein AAGF15_04240 [Pseudomonadota bacterium]
MSQTNARWALPIQLLCILAMITGPLLAWLMAGQMANAQPIPVLFAFGAMPFLMGLIVLVWLEFAVIRPIRRHLNTLDQILETPQDVAIPATTAGLEGALAQASGEIADQFIDLETAVRESDEERRALEEKSKMSAAVGKIDMRLARMDDWLKENHGSVLKMHEQLAQKCVASVEGVERLTAVQTAQHQAFKGQLAEVPRVLQSLQQHEKTFKKLDPEAIMALAERMAAAQTQVEQSASDLGDTADAHREALNKTNAAAAEIEGSAAQCTEKVAAATTDIEAVAEQADAISKSLQEASANLSALAEAGKSSLEDEVASFVTFARAIGDAAQKMTSATARMENSIDETASLTEGQAKAAAQAITAFENEVQGLGALTKSELAKVSDDVRQAADAQMAKSGAALEQSASTAFQKIEASVGGGISKLTSELQSTTNEVISDLAARLEAQVSAIGEMLTGTLDGFGPEAREAAIAATQALKETCDTYSQSIAGELEALGANTQLLADVRKAASTVTTLVEETADYAERAQQSFDGQIRAQKEAMEALSEASHVIGEQTSALASVETDTLEAALQNLKVKTDEMAGQTNEIGQSLRDEFEAQTNWVRTSIERLSEQLSIIQSAPAVGEELTKSIAPLEQGIGELKTQVATLGDIANDRSPEIDALSERLDERLEGLANRLEIVAEASSKGPAATSALRQQIRQLGQQVGQQGEEMRGTLKELRSQHLQSLKSRVRQMPEETLKLVLPTIEEGFADIKDAMQDLFTSPAIENPDQASETAIEPLDTTALSIGERLAQTMAAMDAIEEELTGLAAAALAAPEAAGKSQTVMDMIADAEKVLTQWTGKLNNTATAIAIAKDAA